MNSVTGVTVVQEPSPTDDATVSFRMDVWMYVVGAVVIVLCLIINGCLLRRRWKKKRRMSASAARDEESGGGTSQKSARKESHDQTEASVAVILREKDSADNNSSHSLTPLDVELPQELSTPDQDLGERRRSSATRVKVLPVVQPSCTSPKRPPRTQTPADNTPPKSPVKNERQETRPPAAENQPKRFTPKRSLPVPDNSGPCKNSSSTNVYETLNNSVPNVALKVDGIGSASSIPAIVQTNPNDEAYDCLNFENEDIPVVTKRKHPSVKQDFLKRRSYSFDHSTHSDIPPHLLSPKEDLKRPDKPIRGRSASESRQSFKFCSDKLPKHTVKFALSVKDGAAVDPVYFTLDQPGASGPGRSTSDSCQSFDTPPEQSPRVASNTDPAYFTLEPDIGQDQLCASIHSDGSTSSRQSLDTRPQKSPKISVDFADTLPGAPNADPAYFTLEPDKFNDHKHDRKHRTLPPSKAKPMERDFTSRSFKKGLNTLFSKKSKGGESKTPPPSPGRNGGNSAKVVIYDEPGAPQVPSVPVSDASDNASKIRAGFLRVFPKRRSKTKAERANHADHKTYEDENGTYEILQIPSEDAKTQDGPLYDTLEVTPASSPKSGKKKVLPLIGQTTTGTPLRQFRVGSARRDLPSTPNEYDKFRRGTLPTMSNATPGAVNRRGSSPTDRTPPVDSSTAYNKLSIPDSQTSNSRPSSMTDAAPPEEEQPYDLLDPETFIREAPDSTDQTIAYPKIARKPQKTSGCSDTNVYDFLDLDSGLRRGSMDTRTRPRPAPRLLLRSNSVGKIQKVFPKVASDTSTGVQDQSTKPVVHARKTVPANAKKLEPEN